MANFIVNSNVTIAVRKETVSTIEIISYAATEQAEAYYALVVHSTQPRSRIVEFETDSTLVGIQAKAASVLEDLEEA